MSNSGAAADRRRGKLIVISGPSGAGKSSICRTLVQRLPGTFLSVSATTRPIRPGEVPGRSYEFLSREEFQRRAAAGDFLEMAEYIGYLYGTPKRAVEEALAKGCNAVLEIEVQGGMQVAAKVPDAIMIFILPPNMDSLRARLEGRNTEAQEQLARRLAEADGEIAAARDSGCYKYFVVNDVLETTVERVERIIAEERTKS
jgi:guanylate kinase